MITASLFEAISIGSVIPFMTIVANQNSLPKGHGFNVIGEAASFFNSVNFLGVATILFCAIFITSGLIRLALLHYSTKVSFQVGADLGSRLYKGILNQPYIFHLSHNSSEVIDGVINKSNAVIYQIINPILTGVTAIFMIGVTTIVLLLSEPIIAIFALSFFGVMYFLIAHFVRVRLVSNSLEISKSSHHAIKALQEGVGGIRDVIIYGAQNVHCDSYQQADARLRRAQSQNQFIASAPKFIVEMLGMVFIATLMYALYEKVGDIASALPVLGVLVVAAQRLMPSMQQAYQAWSTIKGSQASLSEVLSLLDMTSLGEISSSSSVALDFDRFIELVNVSFRYDSDRDLVIQDVNIAIPKGSRVAIVGVTGGGKSTLLDLLMGLTFPTEGVLKVDGISVTSDNAKDWRRKISHVPQSIFLLDATLAENIAFGSGSKAIDMDRVEFVAKQAQLDEEINSWPLKYQTPVGERGVRLSGGQRQRLGIARALYRDADVLILDEATSALDSNTELRLMNEINRVSPKITIIMVAHRLTSLRNVSCTYELVNGSLRKVN